MKQERILQIIRGPVVTENSSAAIRETHFFFSVGCDAIKEDLKAAVEQLLDVKVVAVNTVNIKGKLKRFGQRQGYRKSFKKAYISLSRDVDMEALLSEQQA